MADIKPLTIWTVYHNDAQIAEYGLKETETRKLYANHHTDADHEVNVLNPAWSELTAMFWIWWNTTDTQCIGINHYRRQFDPKRLPLEGEVCIYQMDNWGSETVAQQFARHHGKEALDVMIDCLINHDDKGEWYADNILNGHLLVRSCCFVMTTKDYDRMVARMGEVASRAFCVRPANDRALDPAKYAESFREIGIPAEGYATVAEGVRAAAETAKAEGKALLCLGSLYMYGEVRAAVYSEDVLGEVNA